jgi:hypothetical protein
MARRWQGLESVGCFTSFLGLTVVQQSNLHDVGAARRFMWPARCNASQAAGTWKRLCGWMPVQGVAIRGDGVEMRKPRCAHRNEPSVTSPTKSGRAGRCGPLDGESPRPFSNSPQFIDEDHCATLLHHAGRQPSFLTTQHEWATAERCREEKMLEEAVSGWGGRRRRPVLSPGNGAG